MAFVSKAIQVVFADHDIPRNQLVLRDPCRVEGIVVPHSIERRSWIVIGQAQQEHPTKSRVHRTCGQESAVSLQLTQVRAMRLLHFDDFFNGLSIADNDDGVHMLRILVCGGTFDKQYDEITGRLFFKDTHVPEMLRLGRSRVELTIETLMMIDSLDMSDAERARIAARCIACEERRIVITHGTDTMIETAAILAQAPAGKTMVLTGAMVPYAFGSSDGLFNLGSAVSFAQVLPSGVYVAMNGTAVPWNGVRKNRQSGVFEPVV